MQITDIVWKEGVVERLTGKHGVSAPEAEEVPLSRPVVRRMGKGRVRGENVYAAMAQVAGGRYVIVFLRRLQLPYFADFVACCSLSAISKRLPLGAVD